MTRLHFIPLLIGLLMSAATAAMAAPAGSGKNVPYNGGQVMRQPTIYPIYWIPDGYQYYPDSSHSNQNYINLTQSLLSDLSGSSFYGTVTQYYDRSGHIANSYDLQDGLVDTNPFPGNRGSLTNPLRDVDIRKEIFSVVSQQGIDNQPGETLYIVYTPFGVHSCTSGNASKHISPTCDYRGGKKGWCGYHSWFSSRGSRYIYATILDVDTFCHQWQRDLTDDQSPNGDARGDIAADVTSHELFEAVTDPFFNAWAAGSTEIGDKCSSLIGPVADDGSDITLAGDPYLLQKEWSNAQGGCVI